MAQDQDYDVITAKISRTDKDGNDITGDRLAKGGRRRPDGTLSAVPYDIKIQKDNTSESELNLQLAKLAAEDRQARRDVACSTISTFSDMLDATADMLKRLMDFLEENPDAVQKIKSNGRRVKRAIADTGEKIISKLKKEKSDFRTEGGCQHVLAEPPLNESMSVDEARKMMLEILLDYIDMKKKVERLSKACIGDINIPELDISQVLAYMESIIKDYPTLMDESTSLNVINILGPNLNSIESTKILTTLKIKVTDE